MQLNCLTCITPFGSGKGSRSVCPPSPLFVRHRLSRRSCLSRRRLARYRSEDRSIASALVNCFPAADVRFYLPLRQAPATALPFYLIPLLIHVR